MAFPAELITVGGCANPFCKDCDSFAQFGVYQSAAGHYIGTQCKCGPYSRDSLDYYRTEAAALLAARTNTWKRRIDIG